VTLPIGLRRHVARVRVVGTLGLAPSWLESDWFTASLGNVYRQHSLGVIDRTLTGLNVGHIHVPRMLRPRSQSVWMDLHHQLIAYRASTLLLSYRRETLFVLCVDLNH
jgi:hypothetical protein